MQLNLSEISFSYHDDLTHTPVNAGFVMVASDIDGAQSICTDMGNQMIYLDPDSNIEQRGDDLGMIDQSHANYDGLNSSPSGTAILVGTGRHFFYTFKQESVEDAKKNVSTPNDWDWASNTFGRGLWLNLFGNPTTMNIVSKPTPPEYLPHLPEPEPKPDPKPDPKPEPNRNQNRLLSQNRSRIHSLVTKRLSL